MSDNLNSKGNKRGMSEKSKKNLIPMSERSLAERRECALKGAEKTNEIRRAKVERAEARNYIWNELYGKGKIQEILDNGSTKDIIDLVKALLPPEKQTQEIIGNLGIEKVYITKEEKQDVQNHIDDFING